MEHGTVAGFYLMCHASAEQPFVARPSLIEGAGLGLFALREFRAGDVLLEYAGTVHRTRDALRERDKSYLMRLGEQTYVDARSHPHIMARYINDCRNAMLYNVRFDKRPAERRALVVATRRIVEGDELFVDYGRIYWASESPSRLSLADLARRRGHG